MSWKLLAGKGTWLGTATAAVVLLAALGVSSLLLLRGIVPERAMGPLVWGSSVLACFFGGRMAIRQGGDGPLPRALAVSACVFGAMWIAALTGNEAIHFTGSGIAQTCAVRGGGLLAGLIGIGLTIIAIFPMNYIIHTVSGNTDVNAALPIGAAFILIALSVVLTLLGGLIPANKASKSDPVTALRTE